MTLSPCRLDGVFLPMTTPFEADGALEAGALKVNTHLYATSGVHGLLVLGSNGENQSLTETERGQVLEIVAQYRHPDQLLMAGCIGQSLQVVLQEIHRAQAAGYDCVLVLPPGYFRAQMSDDALVDFFLACADASPLPLLLYNAPQFSGIELSLSIMERVGVHPNIIGLKHSASTPIEPYLTLQSDSFRVLVGNASLAYPAMQQGVKGMIVNLGTVIPRAALELFAFGSQPRSEEGLACHERMKNANNRISGMYGVPGVKAAMDMAGHAGLFPRSPLQALGEEAREDIRQGMIEAGLI